MNRFWQWFGRRELDGFRILNSLGRNDFRLLERRWLGHLHFFCRRGLIHVGLLDRRKLDDLRLLRRAGAPTTTLA